ncbi:MAG: amino acid deaminase, partial [Alphaproteobacteria bacterium]|nr:amino acid deaminase [Alphaproteobacteria bacterium]
MTVSATMKAAHPPLSPLDKGVPGTVSEVTIDTVADRQWSLLREDIPLPAAVIKQEALRHNREWMKSFLADSGVALAPHGKTTMCPALFDMQLDDGAWAITVATPHQLQVARAFGYSRIFCANQLVGKSAFDYVMRELANDPA